MRKGLSAFKLRLRYTCGSHMHLDKNNFKALTRARTPDIQFRSHRTEQLANTSSAITLTFKTSMFKRRKIFYSASRTRSGSLQKNISIDKRRRSHLATQRHLAWTCPLTYGTPPTFTTQTHLYDWKEKRWQAYKVENDLKAPRTLCLLYVTGGEEWGVEGCCLYFKETAPTDGDG